MARVDKYPQRVEPKPPFNVSGFVALALSGFRCGEMDEQKSVSRRVHREENSLMWGTYFSLV
jgi:hypothetical protein